MSVTPRVGAVTLSVDETIKRAVEHSRGVAAAEAGVEKARADERKALLAMSPKVNATGMYRYQTPLQQFSMGIPSDFECSEIPWAMLGLPPDLTPEQYGAVCEWYVLMNPPTTFEMGVHHNYTVQVAVDQVLFAGNALRQVHWGAKELVSAGEAQVRQARAEAAYSAEQLFYGLHLARESAKVISDAQKTMDAYVADLSNLVSVGMGLQSDLLAAQARQSSTRLDLMKATRGVKVAEMAFRAALGLSQDEEIALVLGEAKAATFPLEPAQLLELARKHRPELLALDSSVSALEHYAKASWGSWVPVLALNATYMGQKPDPYSLFLDPSGSPQWYFSTNVSLVASWTLWDQGAAYYGHKAAAASLLQLKEQRGMLTDMLPVEIESALSAYLEAEKALEVAHVGLAHAEEAYRLEQNRFQQGMTNNTQILLAQSSLSGARLSLLLAETEQRTSHAALRKAIGTDPESQP